MAGFYYEAPSKSSTLWTFFLEGGGACSTKADCTQRSQGALGSSNYWAKTRTGQGVLSTNPTENPDFSQGHHVYIPYCGGDVHAGQRTTPSVQTWGFYFSGHLIITNIFEYLIKNYKLGQAENVLVSGCSAGGIGTFANADWISTRLKQENTKMIVKAAPVAGWFFAGNCTDEQNEEWDWAPPNDYPHWIKNETGGDGHDNSSSVLWDSYLLPTCTSKESIPWHCETVHVAYKYMTTPVMVLENIFDSQQLNGELGLPSKVTTETKEYVAYFGYDMLLSMANQVESPNGLFLPSCYDHCSGIGYGDYGGGSKTKIKGYNVTQVLGDWFWERNKVPHILVDDCKSNLPCNPTCKGYGI
eukprot:188325_1